MKALVALALFALPLAASAAELRFEKRTVTVNGAAYPYQVFVPESFAPGSKPPVILFLHGAGERGSQGEHTRVGLGRVLRKDPARWPFLVVFPQCPKDAQWIGDARAAALLALEEALVEFHGDRERVSLLGMSMGGAGTWWTAFEKPGLFAAVVPICGYVTSSRGFPIQGFRPPEMRQILESGDPYGVLARGLAKTPLWAFHGDADDTIPVTESRRMAEALRLAGGNAAYTELRRRRAQRVGPRLRRARSRPVASRAEARRARTAAEAVHRAFALRRGDRLRRLGREPRDARDSRRGGRRAFRRRGARSARPRPRSARRRSWGSGHRARPDRRARPPSRPRSTQALARPPRPLEGGDPRARESADRNGRPGRVDSRPRLGPEQVAR